MFHYIAIVCLVSAATAAPSYDAGLGSVSIPRYGFNYAVSDPLTGDNKAQSEQREGGVVKGSYSLSEPDGTIRVVDYTADDVTGFNAVVKRVGPAGHPQPILTPVAAPIAAPIVAAPIVKQEIIQPIAVPAPSAIGLGYGDLGLGLKGGWGLPGPGIDGLGLGLKGLDLGLGGLGLKGGLILGGDLGLNQGLWKH